MTDSNISLSSPDSTAQSAADDTAKQAQLFEVDSIIAGQKHLLETELVEYALDCSKRAKMSTEKQYSAQEFAMLPPEKQLVSLHVDIQQILERIVKPSWSVPASISVFLEIEVHTMLTSPTVKSYVRKDGPLNEVMAKLQKQTQWSDLQADPNKWMMVRAAAQAELDTQLNMIKFSIAATRRTRSDIITLSSSICRSPEAEGQAKRPTLPRIMRIAFLRYCYSRFIKAAMNGSITARGSEHSLGWDSFWEYVDRELSEIRYDANHDPVKILIAFKHILIVDQSAYRLVDLD